MANRLPMMIVGRIIGVPDTDIDKLIEWGYAATQMVEGLVTQAQNGIRRHRGDGTQRLYRRAVRSGGSGTTRRPAGRSGLGMRDRRPGRRGGVDDDDHAVQRRGRIHGLADRFCRLPSRDACRPPATTPATNPTSSGRSSKRCSATSRPFVATTATSSTTPSSSAAELEAGSRLLLLWGAANRDPSHFDEPAEFRLDRAEGKGHISFGKGAHFCVGAALARLEARIVIEQLLDRTSAIDVADVGRWLPSLLVRRLERLELAFG